MPQNNSQEYKTEILLSTYNGELYLKEQLDSITRLNGFERIKVSIRDDGSCDKTVEILKDYEKLPNFNISFGSNIGINASMNELIKGSEPDFDFFAYCDQDDVWHKSKIEYAAEALGKENSKIPLLFGAREELTDKALNPIGLLPFYKKNFSFYNALIQNPLPGHSQVFNKSLRDILIELPMEHIQMYDWLTLFIAASFGKVFYGEKICGKYRKHGDNVIGYELNPFKQIKRRLRKAKKGVLKDIATQTYALYFLFKHRLNKDELKEFEKFISCNEGLLKRINYSLTTKLYRQSLFESLQFRILYLTGRCRLSPYEIKQIRNYYL